MMKIPALRFWRTVIPASILAITSVLFARLQYPLPPDSSWLLWYSRLDPLLLLGYIRWEGAVPLWGWLPLLTILLTLLAGRVFCGWLCPVGGLLAILQSLKYSVRRHIPSRIAHSSPPDWVDRLYDYRYPWLVFLLAVLALGSGWTLYLSPFHLLTGELSRLWRLQIPWMLLFLIASGILVFPRFWCVFICPTGLVLSVLSHWRRLVVTPPPKCLNCGVCETACPTGAAEGQNGSSGRDCLICGRCSERCPSDTFKLSRLSESVVAGSEDESLFTRREIIRSGVALAVSGAAISQLQRPVGAHPLRPPGALEEEEFLMRCSRCGRCIKACPAQCLKSTPITSGLAVFLTPIIVPREARCELTQDCQKVCPTGAIGKLPIEKAVIGLAVIDEKRCLGWAEGKLCLICQEQCPQMAVDSDSLHRPSILKELCVGCGACENACPVEDPPAVVVLAQSKRSRS